MTAATSSSTTRRTRRVARIRCDVMKCDKIIELPNQQTVHGLRLQKFPRTGYVFCNGEYRVPMPNDGKTATRSRAYRAHLHRRRRRHDEGRLAGHRRRQPRQRRCRLPGQVLLLDLLQLGGGRDARRDDRRPSRTGWSSSTSSASRRRSRTASSRRSTACRCSTAARARRFTRYVPIPNSPHGINTAPDGIHVVANGKLSPTVTVFDVTRLDALFDDEIEPRGVVVAEPRARPRAAAHRL